MSEAHIIKTIIDGIFTITINPVDRNDGFNYSIVVSSDPDEVDYSLSNCLNDAEISHVEACQYYSTCHFYTKSNRRKRYI